MSKQLIYAIIALLVCLSCWLISHNHIVRTKATPNHLLVSTQLNSSFLVHISAEQTRRLQELEKSGQIPVGDHQLIDWQLAQQTTWWGKPLDAKLFWKGRVLWNDKAAMVDAHRFGRAYPPMPYDDTNLPPYPNDEGVHGTYLPDSRNVLYASSTKERAFWDRFDKTNPRPTDQIEQEQLIVCARGDREHMKGEAIMSNYPGEAFTDQALFWSYVQSKRIEYQRSIENGNTTNDLWFQTFLSNLRVDARYVVEPLAAEQLLESAMWKIEYLQRLRRDNVDEQYIQGYLQVWNLSSNQVFGVGN